MSNTDETRLQEIDFPIRCDMQHPPTPGSTAVPCNRPAAYFATVHDCRKKRDYPNNGSKIPICQWYLDLVKDADYPFRCPGCTQEQTQIHQVIWDLENLTPAK